MSKENRATDRSKNINQWGFILIQILLPIAFGLFSIKIGQDINWDLHNYQLYNPYSYLNDRVNLDLAPAGLQTYFNPALDVAYFIAITHLSPKTVGFLLASISIYLAFPLLMEYLVTGLVPRMPTAILSVGLMLSGQLALVCGFVLDNVTRGRQELRRLAYLAIPVFTVVDEQ